MFQLQRISQPPVSSATVSIFVVFIQYIDTIDYRPETISYELWYLLCHLTRQFHLHLNRMGQFTWWHGRLAQIEHEMWNTQLPILRNWLEMFSVCGEKNSIIPDRFLNLLNVCTSFRSRSREREWFILSWCVCVCVFSWQFTKYLAKYATSC